MNKLMIFTLTVLFSSLLMADDDKIYEISCERIKLILSQVNENLSHNRQIAVTCESSSWLTNNSSKIQLSTPLGICPDSEYFHESDSLFPHEFRLVMSEDELTSLNNVLADHGFKLQAYKSGYLSARQNVGFSSLSYSLCD
jgi:hypothetical protein